MYWLAKITVPSYTREIPSYLNLQEELSTLNQQIEVASQQLSVARACYFETVKTIYQTEEKWSESEDCSYLIARAPQTHVSRTRARDCIIYISNIKYIKCELYIANKQYIVWIKWIKTLRQV